MDLATIKPLEKQVEIKHPATGEPTGLILSVACLHDERVKSGIREANDWALKLGKDMTKAQEAEYDDRLAASYIVGCKFEGDAVWNGETPEYSKALALEFAGSAVIKEQLLKETRSIKDFYKA